MLKKTVFAVFFLNNVAIFNVRHKMSKNYQDFKELLTYQQLYVIIKIRRL